MIRPMGTLALLCLFAATVPGCGGASESTPEPANGTVARPNVVLVTLDTTRVDRIGAYGYEDAETPVLDALAEQGRRYDRAWSPMPLTIPAHATLFTGLLPPKHGIRTNGANILEERFTTLAELFDASGYDTAASVSAFVTTRRWGFDQGFDAYFDEIPTELSFWQSERPADAVVDDLLAWKAEQDGLRPQFVWAHLYDPHFPYEPRGTFAESHAERPYDGEIAWVDQQVGRLVEGWDDNTIFVVVADHGEGHGDHAEATHGLFVYEGTQRIPFILSGPGIEPAVVDRPVSLADVGPILLDQLGMTGLTAPDGVSLDGMVDRPADSPVYMESYQGTNRFGFAPHVAVVSDGYKLIDLPQPELYDIGSDFLEENDLAKAEPERVEKLRGMLGELAFAAPSEDELAMDPSVAGQLAALGYVEGANPVAESDLVDPKERMELVTRSQQINKRLLLGDVDGLAAELEGMVADYPEIVELKTRWARALAQEGKTDAALGILEEVMESSPNDPGMLQLRATLLTRAERYEDAIDAHLKVVEAMPHAPRVRAAAFDAMIQGGQVQRGFDFARAALQEDPEDFSLAGRVGVELVKRRKFEDGIRMLQRGARAGRPEPGVHHQLAALAQGKGEREEAMKHLETELRFWPTNRAAALTYVRLSAQDQDWESLLGKAQTLRRLSPKLPESHYWVVQALFNLERYDEALEAVKAGREASVSDDVQLMTMHANVLAKLDRRDEAEAIIAEVQAQQQKPAPAP